MNKNSDQKLKVIITGATGMVGEGVMHECLQHSQVEAVLVINRRPCGVEHSKLKEIVHPDFFDLSSIEEQLKGYDACFFCLGVSSVGMKVDDYYKSTYSLTLNLAETLSKLNSSMTFCYVSGAGTDSTEKGRSNWARVKGKTENDLMKLPFKQVFTFRPAFIKPTSGLRNTLSFYKYINWLFPIGRAIYPNGFCTLKEIGIAMINASINGYEKKIVTGRDIIILASRS
jgi:uncharacterized protein YbjT (DUF2867 family)